LSQRDLIFSYFEGNPNRDISHAEVVDWAVAEWKNQTGDVFRDPDRAIRKLHAEGLLVKVSKGVYRYDPEVASKQKLENFTASQKQQILERDGYKCVVCGLGRKEGLELHVDHIRPMSRGGKSEIDNGQTLCSIHNFRKKNYNQTETGKKMFINLLNKSKKLGDEELTNFCEEILKTYDNHNINGHIEWKE